MPNILTVSSLPQFIDENVIISLCLAGKPSLSSFVDLGPPFKYQGSEHPLTLVCFEMLAETGLWASL